MTFQRRKTPHHLRKEYFWDIPKERKKKKEREREDKAHSFMPTCRNYVGTLNNYTEAEENHLKTFELKDATYLICGRERGASGTPHLQCYFEFSRQTSISQAKITLGSNRFHLEKRRGTQQEAIDYCKKEGDWFERGVPATQGRRNDLIHCKRALDEGKTVDDIYEQHPQMLAKFPKFVAYGRGHYLKHKFTTYQAVECTVYWGATGTGKTRRVHERSSGLPFRVQVTNNNLWFDGYDGQEDVLFDEFRGGIKYSKFLELIDGYPFQLPVKGTFTWKCWKRVWITSNIHPRYWYKHFNGQIPPELNRRLTHIIECTTLEEEYDEKEEEKHD